MKLFFKTAMITTFLALFAGSAIFGVYYFFTHNEEEKILFLEKTQTVFYIDKTIEEEKIPEPEIFEEEETEQTCPFTVKILISAAGDVTLGGDRRWSGFHAFMREFDEHGYEYFFSNVEHIFAESDLSIVNFEGVLTDETEPHMDKEFVFRAPTDFAKILKAGNISAVSLANNHSNDYFQRGYNDTKDALSAAEIEHFGNDSTIIIEVNGIKIGLFGHRIWHDSRENHTRIRNSISNLRSQNAQLIVAYFHWGVENENIPEQYQINIGRLAVREGADLVLGSHPHVIQRIEKYNERFIVYSLADFCFGGNAHPADFDAFIFQQEFTFFHGILQPENEINIIPVSLSSVRNRNDFRPTPAEGAHAERILQRLRELSNGSLF
ncbi:MAG: CapA family protein [Defluviitaleaceae bacterium]|nr:CapA family protein [Defluviitaleaceae bacterium]